MYEKNIKNELGILADISLNIVAEEATLLNALESLDRAEIKVLLVVKGDVFVATATDGDIRRSILAGASLETTVSKIANYQPMYLKYDNPDMAQRYLETITALPVVNSEGKIQKVYINRENKRPECEEQLNLPIVIMAGGLGTRLYPYTKILPKPLIPVLDIPISERIILSFQKIGCREFHMIVNYKRNMIKAYFNDADNCYDIHFWDEEEPLGTGGGLQLLKNSLCNTFVLTNSDILILDDVRKIIEHHQKEKNKVTMVCSLKKFEIPYGVVHFSDGGEISSFEEKPQLSFFTNTGYYILEPEIFSYINYGERISMPDIIDRMRLQGEKVGVYPISENAWLDMGQFDSMESMERKLKELAIS